MYTEQEAVVQIEPSGAATLSMVQPKTNLTYKGVFVSWILNIFPGILGWKY